MISKIGLYFGIIIFQILTSCGAGNERETIAHDYLKQKVKSESKSNLNLESFKKTNGYDKEQSGMRLYVLEWVADLRTTKEVWKMPTYYPRDGGYWTNFEVRTTKPSAFEDTHNRTSQHLEFSSVIHLTGETELQKTEQGWIAKNNTIKTWQILVGLIN